MPRVVEDPLNLIRLGTKDYGEATQHGSFQVIWG